MELLEPNGARKSTFLKSFIRRNRTKQRRCTRKGERLSVLKQDHFAFEEYTVIDTVIMGNKELYNMKEKGRIICKTRLFCEEDGMKAAKLEERFAELDGWNAESDAERNRSQRQSKSLL